MPKEHDEIIHYRGLKARVTDINMELTSINKFLEQKNIDKISAGNNAEGIAVLYREGHDEFSKVIDPLRKIVTAAIKLSSQIEQNTNDFTTQMENDLFIENQKFTRQEENNKLKRKAERDDMWTLYWHKLTRWTIGAIVTVLLYSSAVALSESWSFIKVPIKDWIPQQVSNE